MKVFVYFNLHKKLFSVKALEGPNKGRVIMHAAELTLNDARFKVSQAGRERVLREKRKNVHAGVIGYLATYLQAEAFEGSEAHSVTYNPYKFSSFVTVADEAPIVAAEFAVLIGRKITAYNPLQA